MSSRRVGQRALSCKLNPRGVWKRSMKRGRQRPTLRLELLERRDLMAVDAFAAIPYVAVQGEPTYCRGGTDLSGGLSVAAEGESQPIVGVTMQVTDPSGNPLDPDSIVVGQYFNLQVWGQDLRGVHAKGIYALFNALEYTQPENLELLIGETQLIAFSKSPAAGSFTLSIYGIDTEPISVTNQAGLTLTPRQLAHRIEASLNGILGADSTTVVPQWNHSTEAFTDFTVNFRFQYAWTDMPPLSGDFNNLLATGGGGLEGNVVDDFTAIDPLDAFSFRNSIRYHHPYDGIRMAALGEVPGTIYAVGGGAGVEVPTDVDLPYAFYSVPFRAAATGTTVFTTHTDGLSSPEYDTLVYPTNIVPSHLISHSSLTIQIGAGIMDLGVVEGSYYVSGQSLTTPGGERWYKFTTVAEGGALHGVELEFQHAQGDLDLELYDAGMQLLEQSASSLNTERVTLQTRVAGEYYVRVSGFEGATNPYFALSINAPVKDIHPDYWEPNPSPAEATDLGPLEGVAILFGLTVHEPGDVDVFRFETQSRGVAGNRVAIDFSHVLGDLDLRLLDAVGNVLATSATARDLEAISLEGRAAGVYFVEVSGFAGATHPEYQLTIEAPAAAIWEDFFEANDSLATATTLEAPDGLATFDYLTLHTGSDVDWFKIKLHRQASTQHYVAVDFRHLLSDVDLQLYSHTGSLLRSSQTSRDQERISLAGLAAGEYFVRVFSRNQAALSAYSVTLSVPVLDIQPDSYEPNGSFATATNLRVVTGSAQFGPLTFHNSSDEDWFRFETVAGATSTHFVAIQFAAADGDLDLELYGPNGSLLRSSAGSGDSERISLAGLDAAIYSIRVLGYGGSTSPRYSLSISAPQTQIRPDIFEPNDALVSATNLRKVEGTLTLEGLTLHAAGNEDWFVFDTSAASDSRHSVLLEFSHAVGNLELELLDGAGAVIRSSRGNQDSEWLSLAGLPRGRYHLRVFGGAAGTTSPAYRLTIVAPEAAVADTYEPNESLAAAFDLRELSGTGRLAGASIHAAGDEDWYRFEIVAASKWEHFVEIQFSHALGDLDAEVYDASGTLMSASRSTLNSERLFLFDQPAGTYYLRVLGVSGAVNPAYTIVYDLPLSSDYLPDRFEPNGGDPEVTLVRNRGTALAGFLRLDGLTIHASDDVDVFEFTTLGPGTLAHSIWLEADTQDGDLDLMLVDLDGTLLGVSEQVGSHEFLSLAGLPPGTYRLEVYGYAGDVNAYSLAFDTPLPAGSGEQDAWTIMIYMTASDLEEFAFQDVNELEEMVARLPGSVNVAILWDQSAAGLKFPTGDDSQDAWGTLGRAFIRPDLDPTTVYTTFELLPEASTGAAGTLAAFVSWATQTAPAERYALLAWDHGAAMYGSNFDWFDSAPADHLLISELVAALTGPGMPKLDLLSFDACMMGVLEIGYNIRSVADVLVASQEVVGADGYDYRTLFDSLVADPYHAGPAQLASGMVQSYQAQYSGSTNGWDTQSAVRTGMLDAVATALKSFTSLALGLNQAQLRVVSQALDAAIGYADPDFRDLGSIMHGILQRQQLPVALRDAARNVLSALDAALIARTNDARRSSGLSVYAPGAGKVNTFYTAEFGGFAAATGWAQFVNLVGSASSRSGGSGRFGSPVSIRDWAESNDLPATATPLYTLSGAGLVYAGLSLHDGADVDWFRFSLAGTAGATHAIAAATTGGELVLAIYSESGAQLLRSSTAGDAPAVSLSGLEAGAYLLRVSSPAGEGVRDYQLTANAPVASGNLQRLGDHGSELKAYPLGLVGNRLAVPGLHLTADAEHWFTIDTPRLAQGQWFTIQLNAPTRADWSALVLDANYHAVSYVEGDGNLLLGYFATGTAERLQLAIRNSGQAPLAYNILIAALTETFPEVQVQERVSGVSVDALPLTDLVEHPGEVLVSDARFEWAQGSLRLKKGVALDWDDASQVFVILTVVDAVDPALRVSFVQPIMVLENLYPFHNPGSPLNVNNDVHPQTGQPIVTALDALILINELNTVGARELKVRDASLGSSTAFLDVNKDGFLTALDALFVINFLNANVGGEGELWGESDDGSFTVQSDHSGERLASPDQIRMQQPMAAAPAVVPAEHPTGVVREPSRPAGSRAIGRSTLGDLAKKPDHPRRDSLPLGEDGTAMLDKVRLNAGTANAERADSESWLDQLARDVASRRLGRVRA
jgi:hypothetical protein